MCLKMLARLLADPNVHSVEMLEERQRLESVSPALPMPPMPTGGVAKSADELESDLTGRLRLSDARSPPAKNKGASSSSNSAQTKTQPKTLMSPMAFAQAPKIDQNQVEEKAMNGAATGRGRKKQQKLEGASVEVTPLTRAQLQQVQYSTVLDGSSL